MKRTQSYQGINRPGLVPARMHSRTADPVRKAVARVKQTVLGEFAGSTGEHSRLLRLALNEAEALAWQTDFPHLFFPALATEKAQSTVAWHERQRAVLRNGQERSFAE